jgi:hypothetical protein
MKRFLLFVPLLWAITSSSQTIYWDFSTTVAATNTSGLIASEILQGNNHGRTTILSARQPSSGYTGASAGNNGQAAVWTGSLVIGSTYFEFTLTPPARSIFKLEAISFGSRSTATGPVHYSLRVNQDAYSSDIATGSFLNNSTWTFVSNSSLSIVSSAGTPITFRLYAYGGTGTTISNVSNWRIDDLSVRVSVTEASPLPVTLSAFKAFETASGVRLQWSNLNEGDIAQYSLERSSDGRNFTSLKQLAALKNDGGIAEYQLTDPSPLAGNNFYRVKAVDKGGETVYSDIIRINLDGGSASLNLYPNPVRDNHLQIQINQLPVGRYTMRIYNCLGGVITSQLFHHNGGSLSQTVVIDNLKKGVYILEINGTTQLKKQFIVQ